MIECNGIWLPDGDTHFRTLLATSPLVDGKGTYQYSKIQMALKQVKQRRCAVDIGAHVGLISRILAREFDELEAFEPIPEHVKCFELNVPMENVSLHGFALGSVDGGEARMAKGVGNSGHAHVADHGDIVVPVRTLDSFNLPDVGFIKIDVEGYEHDVLLGAVETLKRCRPTLMVEQKPNNGRRYGHGDYGALQLLERMGAKIVAQKAGDYVLVWP